MSDNNTADSGSITITNAGDYPCYSAYYYDESSPNIMDWRYVGMPIWCAPNNKKGDDNMRYLYEVILVNPKDDEFEVFEVVAKTETSALMQAYNDSTFNENKANKVDFDDLKTQCRVLMSWEKKQPTTAVE